MGRSRGPKAFRFETFWLQDANCEGIVSDYWGSVGDENDRKIAQNLKGLAIELKELGRKKYSDLSCKINHLERELQRLMEEQIRGREMKSKRERLEDMV